MVKKEVFYKKVGRKFIPVSEYDSELMDSLPAGAHLVVCSPGSISKRYFIDPAYAPMIAAAKVTEDAIVEAIHKASEIKPSKTPISDEEREAWQNLIKVMGDDARSLSWESSYEITQKGIKAMIKEADKLLQNESVRKAYDDFLLVVELSK